MSLKLNKDFDTKLEILTHCDKNDFKDKLAAATEKIRAYRKFFIKEPSYVHEQE